MSPIGRIFIVLNLALAGLFLGWASANLATSQDFKTRLTDKEAELAQYTADKEAEIGSLMTEKAGFEERAGQMREQRDRLEEEKTRLEGEVSKLRSDYDALQAEIAGINANLETYATANMQQTQQLKDAGEQLLAAQATRTEAEQERDEAMEQMRAAQEQLALAEKDMNELQQQVAALEQDNQSLDTKLAMFSEYTGVPLSELVSQPKIDGYVLQVHEGEDFTLVSINVGAEDGVKRGFTFEIWNGRTYKGEVRVETVQDTMCTALLTRPVQGTTIASGDSASTHI